MPTNWSEICAAVLHSLFIFTPSMRLRGNSWFLLRGPMRAIVPVQMDLGQEVTLATEELFGHGQEDDVSVVSWRSFKLPRKIAGSNNGETQALVLTNPSGWSVWPALRCTVLRCVAGIWTKQSDKWAVCSSQILEVYFDALRKYMYTRLLSANLDFDSELQHVFWWEPDECRDSRVFHVDRVFLRLC